MKDCCMREMHAKKVPPAGVEPATIGLAGENMKSSDHRVTVKDATTRFTMLYH